MLWGGVNLSNRSILFNPTVPHATSSRAVETTIDNLDAFKVTAFLPGADNYMENVAYTKADGAWSTNDGNFFWPTSSEYLNFYAYAPADPCKMATSEDADGASFSIDHQFQKLENFSPNAAAAEQKDFIYAYAKGNLTDNGTSGVNVDFKHALTEVSIAAKNDNSAYTVEVTGVKLGNIKSKGTFTFPTVNNATPASWDLAGSGGANYETTWTTANKLGKTVSSLDAKNVAFMLLPQQLATNTKASAGNYIALKVKITMQGGEVLHNDWAYIGINTNWEMGKHYTYTLDFTSGAGQNEAGKLIISGKDIKMIPNVTDWDAKAVDLPEMVISGIATGTFNYKVAGTDHTKYNVTPDASGNWSVPVSKFDGVTNTSYMFRNCTSLTSLDLSHFDTSNVTNMFTMFEGCTSLTSLDLSGWNTSKVTNMESMFYNCSSLTSLDLSHFDTNNVTNMGSMFCCCRSLTSLDLSGWNTSKVTDMSGMFSACHSLTSLDLSGWNTSKVTDTSYMFNNCNYLTTIRMVGCSEATKNKIKSNMPSGCTIVTE